MNIYRGLILAFVSITIVGYAKDSSGGTFKDVLGKEVTLQGAPTRIISLAPSLTEILYSLGLGGKVIGVTTFSHYPPEARKKPKVGSYINLNVEKIISLSPDLVVGTVDGNEPGVVEILEQAGIRVYIVNPRNVEELLETIVRVGEVCGVPERAGRLVAGLKRRVSGIEETTRSLRKPLVFLQINIKPIMTVNRHTFHHDLIRLAGGVNMAAEGKVTYPRISIEEVIRRRPEVILISSMERSGQFEKARQEWLKWTTIPAVRDGRVYLIDSDLIDRPSPRFIEGLELMAELIHPEVNWEE
ncbi:MAG: cobalamin-binding protein [Deltaproteobacteria bacterium]|nr:cobalamin-binding protein [Deltaproteobacteria bacterium]